MATIERFEDLEVWQLARKLHNLIYPLTFIEPIKSDFRFKDQIRGTCGSAMDNISEGFGRGSRNEFINSLTIAKGEVEELKSQLYRGKDVGYFSESQFDEYYAEADLLVRKLAAFIEYLNHSHYKGKKYKGRKHPEGKVNTKP
jgi:four helix bundle protein